MISDKLMNVDVIEFIQEIPSDTLATLMDGKNKTDEQIPMVPLNGPNKDLDTEKESPKMPADIKTHWIDCVSRVIFPLIYFSFVVFYWIYYMNHPDSAISAKVTE